MSTISEKLSKYAIALNYSNLSDEVVRQSKHLLLDTLGVGLGGYQSEPSKITQSVVREAGGRPEATIMGSGERTSCSHAALVNGVMVRYLDFGDVYYGVTPCHPSENIPGALAVGERQHSTGKEVLVSIVLGYELMCRFADTIPYDRLGWLHVSIGGFVVPWVAGKLLGLDEEQMTNAVGISGSANQAFRTRGPRTMMKAMGYPLVSRNGIDAALLAQKGLTGPRAIIETFNHMIAGDVDLTPLTRGGENLKILSSSVKPYAAAGKIIPALTALLPLVKQHGIRAEDVEEINLRTYEFAAAHAAQPEAYRPDNKESADQSLPCCLAIALMEGEVGLEQFREEKWKDPRIVRLMEKVKVTSDPALERLYPKALPAVVEIRTRDGEWFKSRVDHPKGHPLNPMTDKEIEMKFRMLASRLMDEAKICRIIDTVYNIEKVDDIRKLMDLLVV